MEVDNLRMISLADTVGMASPEQVSELVGAVMARYDYWRSESTCTAVPGCGGEDSSRPTTPAATLRFGHRRAADARSHNALAATLRPRK